MTPRQQQIAAAPILSTPQEKVAAMSGDMAQDEDLPEFRHWVEGDYPQDDRDDGTNMLKGIATALAFVGIMLAVAFIFIPMGVNVLRSVLP